MFNIINAERKPKAFKGVSVHRGTPLKRSVRSIPANMLKVIGLIESQRNDLIFCICFFTRKPGQMTGLKV
jgi:hypothetical protein